MQELIEYLENTRCQALEKQANVIPSVSTMEKEAFDLTEWASKLPPEALGALGGAGLGGLYGAVRNILPRALDRDSTPGTYGFSDRKERDPERSGLGQDILSNALLGGTLGTAGGLGYRGIKGMWNAARPDEAVSNFWDFLSGSETGDAPDTGDKKAPDTGGGKNDSELSSAFRAWQGGATDPWTIGLGTGALAARGGTSALGWGGEALKSLRPWLPKNVDELVQRNLDLKGGLTPDNLSEFRNVDNWTKSVDAGKPPKDLPWVKKPDRPVRFRGRTIRKPETMSKAQQKAIKKEFAEALRLARGKKIDRFAQPINKGGKITALALAALAALQFLRAGGQAGAKADQ